MRPILLAVFVCLVALPLSAVTPPYLVKDINENALSVSSYPDRFSRQGGLAYFNTTTGNDSTTGLWRTDGTDAGTLRLASGGSSRVAWQGKVWFVSDTTTQLSSTDGTTAGTVTMPLPSSMPGPATIANLMAGPDHLYFINGSTLWQTDGTTGSTLQVSTIVFALPTENLSSGPSWAATSQALDFVGRGNGSGWALWHVDAGGTTLLKDVGSDYFEHLTAVGNLVFFLKLYSGGDLELWRTDGTAAGTYALRSGVSTQNIVASGSYVYVAANDGSGMKLWRSDGTPGGTVPVATSLPGSSSTFDATPYFALANGTIVCQGPAVAPPTSPPYWSLWAFDGTNTTFLANVPDGIRSPSGAVADTYAVFGSGSMLWRTDGTINGTSSLGNYQGWDTYHNWPMIGVGSTVYFGANTLNGFQLWKTDGTTVVAKPIATWTYNSFPALLRPFNGGVLFTASSNAGDSAYTGTRDLWFSDGTDAGTQKLLANADGSYLTPCGTRAFFDHSTSDSGDELWVTDGTAAGTMLLKDLYPGSSSSSPSSITCIDGHVLFFARTSTDSIADLWRSDGTAAGTVMVRALGLAPSSGANAVESGLYRRGHDVFFALALNYHNQLWRSDGTTAGTVMVKDVSPVGLGNSFVVSGSNIYFLGSGSQASLWKSDGTTAGTTNILTDSWLKLYGELNGHAIFHWSTSSSSKGLCSGDGTATPVCFDPSEGLSSGSWVPAAKPLNGRVYYNTPALRSSDGFTYLDTSITDVEQFLSTAGGRQYFNDAWNLKETDGSLAGTATLMNRADETTASGGLLFISSGELYAYVLPVTATGLAPQSVDPAGGQSVTISGRGFTAPATVTVGGVAATVGSVTATSIVLTTPAHDAGTYDVELVLGDGRRMTLETPLAYICAPLTAAIASTPAPTCPLAPTQLQGSGGTRCAWFPGTGLDDPSSCTPKASVATTTTYTLIVFNASGCASTNDPTVTVSVLPAADATITIPGIWTGNGYASLTAGTTYTASAPDAGAGATYAWSGSAITIDDPTLRSITFHTSCGNGNLTAVVTAPNGCSSTYTLTFSVTPAPTVTAFSPAVVNPGATVTITGTALQCTTQVNLVDQNGRYLLVPVTSANATTVQFRFPGNGPRVSYPYVETAHTTKALHRAIRHDFDLILTSDIMWRSTAGDTSFWFFYSSIDGVRSLTVPTDWQPAAFGDFDGNGTTDIFWRNSTTGETSIWLMSAQSNGMPATAVRSMTIPTDWVPVGSGDFDGDGKIDIFWRNAKTGETSIWYMNGVDFTGVRSWTIPTSWFPVAFGDFDGDGKTDMFWWNPTTGETSIWLMNGTFPSTAVRSITVDPSWVPVGAADFNHDRKEDLFWFNRSTGQTGVWYMNGTSIASWASLVTMPSGWRPIQIGFDDDDYPSTFWYNDTTGETGLWHHVSYPSWTAYQTVSDTTWKPVSLP